jgi:hypothetical protein
MDSACFASCCGAFFGFWQPLPNRARPHTPTPRVQQVLNLFLRVEPTPAGRGRARLLPTSARACWAAAARSWPASQCGRGRRSCCCIAQRARGLSTAAGVFRGGFANASLIRSPGWLGRPLAVSSGSGPLLGPSEFQQLFFGCPAGAFGGLAGHPPAGSSATCLAACRAASAGRLAARPEQQLG